MFLITILIVLVCVACFLLLEAKSVFWTAYANLLLYKTLIALVMVLGFYFSPGSHMIGILVFFGLFMATVNFLVGIIVNLKVNEKKLQNESDV